VSSLRTVVANTFVESLDRLSVDAQGLAKQAAFDLQHRADHPSFQLHRLQGADPDFWSARVNLDIRIILHRRGNDQVICYVDHHDAAYEWARRRKLDAHETTGAAQFVVIDERVVEVIKRITTVQPPAATDEPGSQRPFTDLDDLTLLSYGVPRAWLDVVRQATVDTFLEVIAVDLPAEAGEHLLTVATGGTPVITPKPSVRDPFAHPDARRRFHVLTEDDDALRQALAAPWDAWQLFLHPSQREAVERDHAGPARVTGGPGTGKSVVAVHRAVRLARAGSGRVLLTTFSKTLANRLAAQVDQLLAERQDARERIDVVHLHQRAVELWRANTGRVLRVAKDDDLQHAITTAMASLDAGFTPEFLAAEWAMVLEPHGIRTWPDYARIDRHARGVPLQPSQRERLWPVFEAIRAHLRHTGLETWSDVCLQVAERLEAGQQDGRYTHVVADEVQDFGPAELVLVRALAREGQNDVFLAGDVHQRIYKARTSLARAGLEVRGRATVLRVNYRTTEQIRRAADRMVARDGEALDDERAVSLFSGPEPEFRTVATVHQEVEAVAKWLKQLVSNGYRPAQVGVVGRTRQVVADRARKAVKAAGLQPVDLERDDADPSAGVGICTMHRSKGLQFRAVAVLGVEDGLVPLEKALTRQPDEPARRAFLEREQNLLYVACTRSRERLLVTGVRNFSPLLPKHPTRTGETP
jgi:mRNA-degrading endonuclease YafQ of YafQ-DinJ toxin-antitoxin module